MSRGEFQLRMGLPPISYSSSLWKGHATEYDAAFRNDAGGYFLPADASSRCGGNAALAHAEALLREITDEIKFQFFQSPLGSKLCQVHSINQARTVQGELPLCIP